jgi:hypothetical protein
MVRCYKPRARVCTLVMQWCRAEVYVKHGYVLQAKDECMYISRFMRLVFSRIRDMPALSSMTRAQRGAPKLACRMLHGAGVCVCVCVCILRYGWHSLRPCWNLAAKSNLFDVHRCIIITHISCMSLAKAHSNHNLHVSAYAFEALGLEHTWNALYHCVIHTVVCCVTDSDWSHQESVHKVEDPNVASYVRFKVRSSWSTHTCLTHMLQAMLGSSKLAWLMEPTVLLAWWQRRRPCGAVHLGMQYYIHIWNAFARNAFGHKYARKVQRNLPGCCQLSTSWIMPLCSTCLTPWNAGHRTNWMHWWEAHHVLESRLARTPYVKPHQPCVCVCVRERERECVCVCVVVCMHIHTSRT